MTGVFQMSVLLGFCTAGCRCSFLYSPTDLQAFVVSSAVLVGMWIGGVFQACLIVDRIYSLMCACYIVSLLMATLLHLHRRQEHPSNEVHTKTGQ